jgi:DNA polymerase IV
MRIVCLWVPHFYIQVECLRTPALVGRPVVVGGRPEERGVVVDCSPEAISSGVSPSMSLNQAYHLCPQASFILFEKERYLELWEEILFVLGAFTLRIESDECGLACLDITNTPKFHGSETLLAHSIGREMVGSFGIKARVGVGNSRFVAGQAAFHGRNDTLVIEPGREKQFLSPLSVHTLPVAEEVRERLILLGLKTLGKLSFLSKEALVSQFGLSGNLLWELAHGIEDRRQISVKRNAVYFEKEMINETSLEGAIPLSGNLEGLTEELAAELKQARWLCRKLKLILDLDNGGVVEKTAVFKHPTGDAKEMLRRIDSLLEHVALESPICGVRLRVSEVSVVQVEQESLFRRRPDFLKKLEGVRDYLDALYGYAPLFRIEEDDGNSRLPERRYMFREV